MTADVPLRDLVAVGASAGGVEALKTFVSGLPGDLPATVLVALHLPVDSRSLLPEILQRRCALPVVLAAEGLPVKPGQVVVAHPDAHLLVVDDAIVLGRGPRENGSRPSHDAMLRAAALARGPRTVGVVLTGLLDDGAAGLQLVARYGGACLVQDPAEADFPSMPRAALAAVPTAHTVPLAALAAEVVTLVQSEPARPPAVDDGVRLRDQAELQSALGQSTQMPDGSSPGSPSPYGCPDCHGVLNLVPEEDLLRFRCRTGHAWSGESLVAQQDCDVEDALWTALRVLEERGEMSRRLAEQAARSRREWSTDHFSRRAQEAERSAELLRAVLRREAALPELPRAVGGP